MAKSSRTKVTRIKAGDDAPSKSSAAVKASSTTKKGGKTKKAASPATKRTARSRSTKPTAAAATKNAQVKSSTDTPDRQATGRRNPFAALIGYFKGAWYELRQVRWPNRANTWSLTGALLLFTAFFLALIVALDTLFKYLFQLILGA